MRMMRHFDRRVLRKQDLRDRNWISGNKAAEVYEWKLEKVGKTNVFLFGCTNLTRYSINITQYHNILITP